MLSLRNLRSRMAVGVGLLLVGCSSDGPELGSVSGIVLLDGKPVPSVVVHFQPTPGRPAEGVTNNEGHFTLDYTFTRKGSLVGNSEVYVQRIPDGLLEKGMLPAPRIPAKYLMPFETVNVKSGKNEFTFELSSQK